MGLFSSAPANVLAAPRGEGRDASNAPWAIVTGATSGIGRDIAHELCSRGFNVVVHGRDSKRLEELAEALRAEHGVQTKTLLLDASTAFDATSDAATRQTLAELLAGLKNLRVLINNVGTGHEPSGFKLFEQQSAADITALLNVNLVFTTHLTHALLPALRATATLAAGDLSFVVNAGSLADVGLPYAAVYSGAKAYVRALSRALDTELHADGAGVRVVAAVIGDTDSDGHRVGTGAFTPSSRDMARMMVDGAAGSAGGVFWPYWPHKVQEGLCAAQPYWMLRAGMALHFKELLAKYAKQR